MTQFHGAVEVRGGRCARDPVRRAGAQTAGMERGMISALDDDQCVAGRVLGGHEPRFVACALKPADAKPAALAERVPRKAAMRADLLAIRGLDRPRHGRQEGIDKFAKRSFSDKADTGRVPFVEHRQPALAGDAPDLRLAQSADRKLAVRKFADADLVQEIALILGFIDAAQELWSRGDAGIVSGRVSVRSQAPRIGEARTELDLAVAWHVGIRRAPVPELLEEVRKHAVSVIRRKTGAMQRYAQFRAYPAGVLEVRGRCAIAGFVFVPVRHEQGLDLMAGIHQQQRRYRRVDSTGKRNEGAAHRNAGAAAGRGSSSAGTWLSSASG